MSGNERSSESPRSHRIPNGKSGGAVCVRDHAALEPTQPR